MRFLVLVLIFSACSSFKNELMTVDLHEGKTREQYEAQGQKWAIASQGAATSQAGAKMFALGGNAVDAAVAISFAISVERPQSTGIGGGGFLLLHGPNLEAPIAFDFREKAPSLATSKMYLDAKGEVIKDKSLNGIFAVGVPGLVAGVLEVHRRYGLLSLEEVLAPAIELAQNGFDIYPELAKAIETQSNVLKKYKDSKKIFFHSDGRAKKVGERLVQNDLAKTLRLIAKNGVDGFYRGPVAKALVAEHQRQKGLMTLEDLKRYDVKVRTPVHATYHGYDIYSMSPPSSGGIHVLQILNTIESDNLRRYGVQDARSIHLIAQAMQQAFADRATHLGDADFVSVPVDSLISKHYAGQIRKDINLDKARTSDEVKAGNFSFSDHDETTHFTVMDNDGLVVTSTQTINGWFGSGVVAEGTGIVLNNEMDDFATKAGASNLFGAIGGNKNLVEPGKRPLSSMSPTIVLRQGKPVMALGSPSGTRILTCVALTLLNRLEFGLPLWESVSAMRFHHQWRPDQLFYEPVKLDQKLKTKLEKLGHQMESKDLGCKVQAIEKDGVIFRAVSDPRGEGKALAL